MSKLPGHLFQKNGFMKDEIHACLLLNAVESPIKSSNGYQEVKAPSPSDFFLWFFVPWLCPLTVLPDLSSQKKARGLG